MQRSCLSAAYRLRRTVMPSLHEFVEMRPKIATVTSSLLSIDHVSSVESPEKTTLSVINEQCGVLL
jgi:hypothetical protein